MWGVKAVLDQSASESVWHIPVRVEGEDAACGVHRSWMAHSAALRKIEALRLRSR